MAGPGRRRSPPLHPGNRFISPTISRGTRFALRFTNELGHNRNLETQDKAPLARSVSSWRHRRRLSDGHEKSCPPPFQRIATHHCDNPLLLAGIQHRGGKGL